MSRGGLLLFAPVLLEPALLWLALLLPAALLWRRFRGRPAWSLPLLAVFELARFGPAALGSTRARLAFLPGALKGTALLLVVAALARPAVRVASPAGVEGIDILLCIDVSSSMTARDLDPARSRLDVARQSAARFVASRPGDRIGLLAFARYAEVVAPPTLDHRALGELLAGIELVAADGPEDATALGAAAARAAAVLERGQGRSRVAVLLTDGAENVATETAGPGEIAPLHAAQLCQELAVRVYSIATGASGLAASDPSGASGPAAAAAPGAGALDTGELELLAERTGGCFFAAGDAAALEEVYAEIDQLERSRHEQDAVRLVERLRPLLVAAALLLALALGLETTWLRVLP